MFMRTLFNRRHRDDPVAVERRCGKKKPSIRQVDDNLHDVMDRLEKTVRMSREDFFKMEAAPARPAARAVVMFKNIREACSYHGAAYFEVRACRHPRHHGADTGITDCNEAECPIMNGAA